MLHSVSHVGHASQSIHYPRNHPYGWGWRLLYLVAIELELKESSVIVIDRVELAIKIPLDIKQEV